MQHGRKRGEQDRTCPGINRSTGRREAEGDSERTAVDLQLDRRTLPLMPWPELQDGFEDTAGRARACGGGWREVTEPHLRVAAFHCNLEQPALGGDALQPAAPQPAAPQLRSSPTPQPAALQPAALQPAACSPRAALARAGAASSPTCWRLPAVQGAPGPPRGFPEAQFRFPSCRLKPKIWHRGSSQVRPDV